MESQFFIFDNVKSQDMDLQIMRIDQTGFMETPLFGGANINESKSKKRTSHYFYGVNREPIEFAVQFVLLDRYGRPKIWTPQERNKIVGWLLHDEYKSFQTSDDLGKYYYAIAISNTNLQLINTQGYMEVTFRTNSPYAWSPMYYDSFDLSNNTTSKIIELENKSNVLKYSRPFIRIKMEGSTSIKLKNITNMGKIMEVKNLLADEIIEIDCINRIITSNKIGQNPFLNFNAGKDRYWLDLVRGINRIEVQGKCKIETTMQFSIAQ